MVQLKTYSQVKSFYKRMSKKYNCNHHEGCGCCSFNSTVEIDIEKKRVVIHHLNSIHGNIISSCEVLAVIKIGR